ncbi:ABC transporter permease subunit [Gordonia pseudamarae]|jgi:peptide/nickel transport system permease protein|uniref:ABC transporter permease subunit n=1 Tax=Gordonia pseudamarae TaxID=2831662 RepID=A0ABX6IF84_9ACTN|nr:MULTISPECIES: ABC transporter permease [Gordonia]MBD0021974.1 ABC transporter permease [Gordonia sp. (in: high G+C Gram-positive bacteria)]QHN24843.1 ABC transporter permease subunit [Gordonia pseudamarae]QHN33776.1 ABC transporter permease subunit [Gordonia pseudamarae]
MTAINERVARSVDDEQAGELDVLPVGEAGRSPRQTRGRGAAARRLLLRRTLIGIPSLVLISLAIFGLTAVSPFDPTAAYLNSPEFATQAQRDAVTAAYALDQNWFSAWWHWWGGILTGDLGWSSTRSQEVTTVVAERLPFTLIMAASALISAAVIAIGLGAVIGMRRGGLLDRGCSALATILAATPPFVVSLILVSVFAVGLGAFPTSGARYPGEGYSFGGIISHGVLPYIALTVAMVPWLLLSMRAAVVEAVTSDAVRAARSRGLGGAALLRGHVAPVSVLPTLALLGTRLPELIAGAAIVETVFGWPGLAESLVDSAVALDFPLMATLAVGSAALVLVGSALSDAAAVWIDPRIGLTA